MHNTPGPLIKDQDLFYIGGSIYSLKGYYSGFIDIKQIFEAEFPQ